MISARTTISNVFCASYVTMGLSLKTTKPRRLLCASAFALSATVFQPFFFCIALKIVLYSQVCLKGRHRSAPRYQKKQKVCGLTLKAAFPVSKTKEHLYMNTARLKKKRLNINWHKMFLLKMS